MGVLNEHHKIIVQSSLCGLKPSELNIHSDAFAAINQMFCRILGVRNSSGLRFGGAGAQISLQVSD